MDSNELSEGSATNGAIPKDRTMRKSSSMYLNVRMPQKPDRPHVEGEQNEGEESYSICEDSTYDPSTKVQDLLNRVKSLKHRAHSVFCQLNILKKRGENYEWRENGRWVKYEETVEEGGKRWSKPHVASLSMHYILELRRHLADGVFLRDVECYSVSQVIDKFLDEWVDQDLLDPMLRMHVRTLALKPHRHRHERGRPEDKRKSVTRTGSDTVPHSSAVSLEVHGETLRSVNSAISLSSDFGSEQSLESLDSSDLAMKKQLNERFLRKIPKGSETANILVGEVEDLKSVLCGFMRLNDARELGEISEVPLPTRFILYLLGPTGSGVQLREMGRCISTMMVDEIFREVAYKCRDLDDLIAGVDEFVAQVTVLPPGEWDPKIRIEPPNKVPPQEIRKVESTTVLMEKTHGTDGGDEGGHDDPNLELSIRPFVGLIQDIKRKLPWFPSDFKDSLHIQCLPATLFIFLALLTNNVTFGALLGTGTGSYMGVMECVFAGAVSSILFALFAGQPLNILGSTGPMLVLEKIIYDMCNDNNWDFLSLRFWVGIWTAGFLLLLVIFNLSALVRYLTRFTEECFASLIALIFIYESFKQLAEIATLDAPMRLRPEKGHVYLPHCFCDLPRSNLTDTTSNLTTVATTTLTTATTTNVTLFDSAALTELMCKAMNLTWKCESSFVPDVFLMSVILFATTFFVAIFLVDFRSWPCFPTFVRNIIGDFAILIAILVNVGIDAAVGLPTPKLTVPSEFKPTKYEARGWLVNPISDTNPWWLYIAAGLPALLATILIFMDQHITAVIVNRAEHKLVKGSGYHLDLLVVGLLVAIHSFLGLPWYVAATVNAIAHINSLKKVSECAAPGEKPIFLGVREQRVTALFVGVLSGAAVFITNILKVIPMPVLYGVFFYMGWSALGGMQLIDRILLIFMPIKYQPDYKYLRHVPLWRVHVFTVIQILCLVALWVVKSIKSVSIIFPLLVVFTGVVRKIIECFFTETELKYLDSLLPPIGRKKHDRLESHSKEESSHHGRTGHGGHDKAAFFLNGDRESPPAYDNKGFDTKL